MSVDTGKMAERRRLRFGNLGDVMAEAERLAEAERAGRLRQLGNWTLGQALGHLGTWAEFAFTPAPLTVPFFVRWMLRMRKGRFLYGPMRAGVRIPRVESGTVGTEVMPLEEGLERCRRAMERLERETPTAPNPLFGAMRQQEWIALNCRHAELHLGFFVVE